MISKIQKLSQILPAFLAELGWAGTLRFLKFRRSGKSVNQTSIFHPKRLRGQEIQLRPGTTDAGSFQDFLTTRFYLPAHPLPDAPIIVDLGANIGTAAADFAITFPHSKVYAIEMDPENANQSRINTNRFADRIQIIQAAIWNKHQSVSYSGKTEDGYHISESSAIGESVKTVQALTMQDLLRDYAISHIDYLKIDIEGAEAELLDESSMEWLPKVSQIGCEVHGDEIFTSVMNRLTAAGFHCERDKRHWRSITATRPV